MVVWTPYSFYPTIIPPELNYTPPYTPLFDSPFHSATSKYQPLPPTSDDPAQNSPDTTSQPDNQPINPQTNSTFFRLPPELRNKIYTHLLCPNAITTKNLPNQQTTTPPPSPSTLHPSILSTCRLISKEATPILYTQHTFHTHPSLLTSLPHLSTPARPVLHPYPISLISRWSVSLRLDIDPQFTAERVAKAFSGSEFLEVRVWQARFGDVGLDVLKLFLGVRRVGVCRVRGCVEEGFARWLEGVMMGERGEEGCGKGV